MSIPSYQPSSCDRLVREQAETVFRGEKFRYVRSYYVEPDGRTYTTTALDDVNYGQIYNEYRKRHGIPFPDDIKRTKEMFGMNNATLTTILGFGENQIADYLAGEVPSRTNGKILSMAMDLYVFEKMVDNVRDQLRDSLYEKIKRRIAERKARPSDECFRMIYGKTERDLLNGYARQDAGVLKEVILLILCTIGETYETKMNKLLFYCDMMSYRETGTGMTGLAYMANKYGIIPFRSSLIYSMLEIPRTVYYGYGIEYSPLCADEKPELTLLTESNKEIINRVCEKFKSYTSKEISYANHDEPSWENYVGSNKPIPFDEAFNLTQI